MSRIRMQASTRAARSSSIDVVDPHATSTPRRRLIRALSAFGTLGLTGVAGLAGCGGGGDDTTDTSASTSTSTSGTDLTTANGSCAAIPSETGGPFPADGSNANGGTTVDVLALSGIVRSDIRTDVGSGVVKDGIALTLTLKIVDVLNGCAALPGAAVYIWHCDKDGAYSGYGGQANGSHAGKSFLRGVQLTDANGEVTFTTVYPGWYAGRITHIHCEIYADGNYATGTPTRTTQFAFPAATTSAVYGTAVYDKGPNTSVASFAADNVFSDGTSLQMLTVGGDVDAGYSASLTVGIVA